MVNIVVGKISGKSSLVLVPFGTFCNRELLKVKKGESIVFTDTWRKIQVVMVRMSVIEINRSVFTLLMKHIYGDNMTWNKLLAEWTAMSVSEGFGVSGISQKECFLIETSDCLD